MIRRVGVAAICAVALVCSLVFALPALAQASAGYIDLVSAGSPQAHPGELSVTLLSTSAVVQSSVKAELYAQGSSTPALTVTDFTLTSGTSTSSTTTWTVSSPITQAELPLGSYTIAVQASDTGGDQANFTDAGTLAFIVYPTLTLSVSPNPVAFGQTVTLSGTDIGVYPDGSTEPVAGQEIVFPYGGTTTTDSSGNYSITLEAGVGPGAQLDGEVDVEADANATTAFAVSNVVTINVTTYPVRLTGLAISPATVSYPAGVSISGTLSYEVDGEWQPRTATSVEASPAREFAPCDTCGVPGPWSADTNLDGTFTIAIPGPMAPDTYNIVVGGAPWFEDVSTSVKVPADHVAMVSTSITATLTTTGDVNLRACGQPSPALGDPADMSPFPRGTFEYSTTSWRGPWKKLSGASAKVSYGPPTHYNGCYSAKAKAPGQSDYYRLVTTADTAYQAMASAAIKATKPAYSQITGLRVSPTSVKAGSQVKVSGALKLSRSEPEGLKVRILFRPSGSGRWTVYKTVSTSGGLGNSEDFSAKISLHRSGSVAVRFYGTQLIYGSKSKSVFVRVHG